MAEALERVVTPIASIEQGEASPAGERVLLEAKLVWGGDTIAVRHVRPRLAPRRGRRGEICLRELALDAPCDPELVVGGAGETGAFELRLPNGASVPAGCRMTLRLGRATLRLSLVPDDVAVLPRARPDVRVAFGILFAAALHLVVFGFVARSRSDEGVSEASARVTMQHMIHAAEERALAELAAVQQRSPQPGPPPPGSTAEPHADRSTTIAVARAPAGGSAPAGASGRTPNTAREHAATFGMIAIVTSRPPAPSRSASRAPSRAGVESAAWSLETPSRSLSGVRDDLSGCGGLDLSGIGEPGGGPGAGIPLARSLSFLPGA